MSVAVATRKFGAFIDITATRERGTVNQDSSAIVTGTAGTSALIDVRPLGANGIGITLAGAKFITLVNIDT